MSEPRTPRRSRLSALSILLVLLVLGALIGAASAIVRGASYTSEAQLSWDPSVRAQIDPNYATPDATTFDRQVADQRDTILSDDVVDAVASSTDLDAAQVRDAVTVTTTAGSSVFLVDATASTAVQAERIARATTTAYVTSLRSTNSAALRTRIDALTPTIAALSRQLTASTNAQAAAPLATSIAQLQSQSAAYTAALTAVPVEATVLRTAEVPTSPSSFSVLVSALIGAVIGIVLAVCIVLLLNSMPSRAGRSIPLVRARTRRETPAIVRPAQPAAQATAAAEEAPEQNPVDEAKDAGHLKDEDRGQLTPTSPTFFG